MAKKKASKALLVPEDVMVITSVPDEVRLRKGIWNYEEAVLSLAEESDGIRIFIPELFEKLKSGESVFPDQEMQGIGLTNDEKDRLKETLGRLEEQGFLVDADTDRKTRLAAELLKNCYMSYQPDFSSDQKPILFFSDNSYISSAVLNLCRELNIEIFVMNDSEYERILTADILNREDGLDSFEDMQDVCSILSGYSCIVGAMGRVNISFMRRLNRALIQLNMPLAMAMLDGPFTSVFTIRPPETACFECMEQRVFARMQDHRSYERFNKEEYRAERGTELPLYTPVLLSAACTALMEGIALSISGKAKLAGRVWNTYVPVMEMQIQDILRVPYCPACGRAAMGQVEEMYTSSRAVVDKVLKKVKLVPAGQEEIHD